MAVAGIDIKRVMKGAKEAYEHYSNPNVAENQCYQYAAIRRLLNQKHNRTVEIYEYYEPRLTYFAEWLKQLYGESEGKEYLGIYPSSLLLTRDLHSLGQFLQEGSQIFFETVFKIKQPPADIMQDGMLSFNAQNNAVIFAVNKAHHKNNTRSLHLKWKICRKNHSDTPCISSKTCAVSSMLLGVDPFNQRALKFIKRIVRFDQ